MVEQLQSEPPAPPARFTPEFASLLDLSRWVAALIVVLGHLRNPLVVGFPDLAPADQTLAVKLWYFVSGLDHEAVLVFFVLSGFLVGGMGTAKAVRGRFDIRDYSIDRTARLFIAFIPALLLGGLLDLAGQHWFGWTGFWDLSSALMANNFQNAVSPVGTYVFADNLDMGTLVGNLLMVQSIHVPPLGSNLPLWTLAFEFWFYFVFGAAVVAMTGRRMATKLIAGALILAVAIAMGPRLIGWGLNWACGVAAFLYAGERLRRPWLSAAVFVAVLVFSRLWTVAHPLKDLGGYGVDYLVSAAFGWLLVSWRGYAPGFLRWMGGFNRFMANFSYSLYLLHFPLMLFALAALASLFGLEEVRQGFSPTDPRAIGLYVGVLAIVLAVSWVFAQLTERWTPELRGFLKRRFRPRVAATA